MPYAIAGVSLALGFLSGSPCAAAAARAAAPVWR
jgi:hypothetical protein